MCTSISRTLHGRDAQSILAKGCIVPGFATLITNLVRSYSPEDYSLSQTSWQQEYRTSLELLQLLRKRPSSPV